MIPLLSGVLRRAGALFVYMLFLVGPTVNAGEPDRAVEDLVDGLIDLARANYVIPENMGPIEQRLRAGLESGEYQSYRDLTGLSKRLTHDLRAASNDLHFGIRPKPMPQASVAIGDSPRTSASGPSAGSALPMTGLGRVEILEHDIGYIEILALVDPAVGGQAADDAFAKLAEASALVLDVRASRGGHPGMVARLVSYFFDGDPFLFNSLEWPMAGKTMEFHTVADLPSPRFTGRPVYILTSRQTPSAAEGFSYHMRHLERATIVGERTAGAAHLTQMFELPGFQVAIPTGRPVSPITGGNWEGTGVIPHHEVPAQAAMVRAVELAATATQTQEALR